MADIELTTVPRDLYYHEAAYVRRLEAALTLIAAFKDKTLIAPSMGPDADHGHQVGANKAFNQAAGIATDALAAIRS
jgi:hypothetical protein